MNKLGSILEKHKEQIRYLFFGVLTTIVSYGTYIYFTRYLRIDIGISNILSWITSVIFAYITNKLYVFQVNYSNKIYIIKEFLLFILSRIFSGIVDTGLLLFFVHIIGINDLVSKVINGVIVVIINYILSKFIIFKE